MKIPEPGGSLIRTVLFLVVALALMGAIIKLLGGKI